VDTKIAALEREIESKHGESQREIERVDTKVDTVTVRAAQISGGISLLGFALAMISWLWKGH
jgi:hypothetical protein